MKKIMIVLVVVMATLTNAYCQVVEYVAGDKSDFIVRTTSFVEQTKKACDEYSDSEWSASMKHFDTFDDEFDEIKNELTDDDKSEFRHLKGIYAGLVTKNSHKIIGKKSKRLYSQKIKPFFNGVYEAIKDND